MEIHADAKELIINSIKNLENELEFLQRDSDKEFINNRVVSLKAKIKSLQSSIQVFTQITNKKLKDGNDRLRLRLTKNSNVIDINTVIKHGKKYAIVPLELLPKYIGY